MNKTVQAIIREKKICYFVSPHFDDAILSAGGLMSYLTQHTNVVVINVFTKAGYRPYTLSAIMYLKKCGYADAEQLYADRKQEDTAVLKKLGVKIINLEFTDALWRKKKANFLSRLLPIAELRNLYPIYRFHIANGKIAPGDNEIIAQIKKKLKTTIKDNNAVVFSPLATGSHVDHIVTRTACEEAFPSIIYWSDFPYNENANRNGHMKKLFSFASNLNTKKKLVEGYVTQYKAMFPRGFTPQTEEYFMKISKLSFLDANQESITWLRPSGFPRPRE